MYDDVVNDPKVLCLSSDALRWQWVSVLCIASKNGGKLPPIAHIAVTLRLTPQRAAVVLVELHNAGLLDKQEDGSFVPHNWSGRQYKSDTSNERVARHRERKRNATSNGDCNVTVAPPDTETEADTEKVAEAPASGAEAPRDPRARLFDEGLTKIAAMTGKGPDSCRSFIGKCLKAASDDASKVLGLIDDAERNRVVDAPAWISARLKNPGPLSNQPAPGFTLEDAVEQWAKLGKWPRGMGGEPGMASCRASAELLAQYGLLPDGRKMPPREAA